MKRKQLWKQRINVIPWSKRKKRKDIPREQRCIWRAMFSIVRTLHVKRDRVLSLKSMNNQCRYWVNTRRKINSSSRFRKSPRPWKAISTWEAGLLYWRTAAGLPFISGWSPPPFYLENLVCSSAFSCNHREPKEMDFEEGEWKSSDCLSLAFSLFKIQ